MLRDVLRDSWAYQEILQEGVENERQQELLRQRQALITFMQLHFPNVVHLAQKQADTVKDPETLQNLVLKLFAAQTGEQAAEVLLSVDQIAGQKKKKK